jgi:hypothetical protein
VREPRFAQDVNGSLGQQVGDDLVVENQPF